MSIGLDEEAFSSAIRAACGNDACRYPVCYCNFTAPSIRKAIVAYRETVGDDTLKKQVESLQAKLALAQKAIEREGSFVVMRSTPARDFLAAMEVKDT